MESRVNHTLRPAAEMSTAELVNFLKETDAAYRSGASIIDDTTYDEVYRAELISRDPAHPYLHSDKLENRVTPPMKKAAEMSTAELVTFLKETNAAYRSGAPIIDDATYDEVYRAELVSRDPTHSFLNPSQPEAKPSSASTKKEVRHLNPMLSIEKAYTQEDITSFITRVIKYADEQGIKESEIQFRITPKLDGMAANYQDDILATRGDGHTGNDITNNLQRGLITLGGANTGLGEIVISEAYFDENLSDLSSNPSSFVTNLISAANLSKEAIEAMQDKVIRFVPYSLLNHEVCDTVSLRENVEMLCSRIEAECEYPVDGSVIGVLNPEIREAMGSTEYHYNWQIAKKTKDETADLESDSEKLIDLSGGLSINAERPGDNDSLGRERLVDSIAELISHSDQVAPLTIGLLGDWGAGKTTVLNLLERTLDKENKEGINYTVEVFNAWSYEHTESIQAGVAHSAIVGLNRTKKGRLKWFKRVWLSLKLQFKLAPMKATGYSLIVGTWLAGISYLAINGRLQTAWEIGLGATLETVLNFVSTLKSLDLSHHRSSASSSLPSKKIAS